MKNFDLSELTKNNKNLSLKQQIHFVIMLSIPGILSQISSIFMQYIDAAMVGSLGANASAAIGLTASSTWVLGSLSNALAVGFTVQVAHAVGAGNKNLAKTIFYKSIKMCLSFSFLLLLCACLISKQLPIWLGAQEEIQNDASFYFMIFGLSAPFYMMIFLMSGMLQCSGNMKIPSILNTALCLLDALFNVIFIKFCSLGVKGAALGSAVSALLVAIILVYFTVYKSDYLNLRYYKKSNDSKNIQLKAIKLSVPIAVEQTAFTGALVAVTRLIAPLGAVSLAANSFAVTAEALCYMLAYGIQEAATTLAGQSMGAKRLDLLRRFSYISVTMGMLIMAIMGAVMYLICPFVFTILTPDIRIQELATKVLRIELFAEPFYGAAIVCMGILRGKGDTLIPSILNLISIWIVRFILSIILVQKMALVGIWLAMAIELMFRGIVLLCRLTVTNHNDKIK